MSHPNIRSNSAAEGVGETHEVGDQIYFAGNEGRIIEVSSSGMITVKSSDTVQVIDPQNVHIWNQRIAYKQLVDGLNSGSSPGDIYIRKDEIINYILTRQAYYNTMRYSSPDGKSPDWVEAQLFYDLLKYLKVGNTNKYDTKIAGSL